MSIEIERAQAITWIRIRMARHGLAEADLQAAGCFSEPPSAPSPCAVCYRNAQGPGWDGAAPCRADRGAFPGGLGAALPPSWKALARDLYGGHTAGVRVSAETWPDPRPLDGARGGRHRPMGGSCINIGIDKTQFGRRNKPGVENDEAGLFSASRPKGTPIVIGRRRIDDRVIAGHRCCDLG